MSEQLEKCKWCKGSGVEYVGHFPCPDCQGTGYKGGIAAVERYEKMIDELIKESESSE